MSILEFPGHTAKIRQHWDEISKAYLSAPNTHGLVKKLANQFGLDYASLRQELYKSNLRDERESLKNKLPIKQEIRSQLAKLTAEDALKPLKKVIEEGADNLQRRMDKHVNSVLDDLESYAAENPYEFGTRLSALERTDALARKLYGLSSGEEVDSAKRGIAFLAFGMEPKPVQGRVVEE